MGYTTNFMGVFTLDRPLDEKYAAYLRKFKDTRRIKRNEEVTAAREDEVREATGLPVGDEGGYYVGSESFMGQDKQSDAGVVDSNSPPKGQPGLWCQWTVGENNDTIEWDRGEKFYSYQEWLVYIVDHFLKPWGYILNGGVAWQGEEESDTGILVVDNNKVSSL